MIIAAHNPTPDWQLPEKPGIGAVILAHMANVPLVPVTVEIESSIPAAQARDMTRVKNIITRDKLEAKISFVK